MPLATVGDHLAELEQAAGGKDRPIVVYCRTGVEASMTYFVLRYLGFRPALYDGSFVDWNKTEPVARAMR